MNIPAIPCSAENHYKMPLQFICLNPLCLKNAQQLICIYCCQELHQYHMEHIQALKSLVVQFKKAIKPTQYGTAQILLNGISRCRTEKQFHQNITELINYNIGGVRFQKIIDKKNQLQKEETKQFYEERNKNEDHQKTVKKSKKQSLTATTSFITPILTFSAEDAAEQGFQLVSPFCVVNSSEKLVTAFAYPPLNRYLDSIEMNVKIEKITPFWMGIGVSFDKKKYQPDSKHHILCTSNGWISAMGKLIKTQVKYCIKDTLKIKVDKRMQLIEFICNSEKSTVPFEPKWNDEIYLCCVLFYKFDSVQIMAA